MLPVPLSAATIYSRRRQHNQGDEHAPPFRADHVGSLLRPPELLRARADHAAGRITREALRRIEDAAVAQAVRMQEDIGLQGVTDGEFRRLDWLMDFKFGIGGVEKSTPRP